MSKEYEKLIDYAKERASEVDDISMDELEQLVIDGGRFVIKSINEGELTVIPSDGVANSKFRDIDSIVSEILINKDKDLFIDLIEHLCNVFYKKHKVKANILYISYKFWDLNAGCHLTTMKIGNHVQMIRGINSKKYKGDCLYVDCVDLNNIKQYE